MRVTVFTFATDDDSGTESQAFGSEYARDAAAWDWCRDRCDFEDLDEDEVKRKYPEWVDLYKKINDSFSTCSTDQHTIEVPNNKYRVRVYETVYYDVFVDAANEIEARELACDMDDCVEVDSTAAEVEGVFLL